jgi:hypothetical protein
MGSPSRWIVATLICAAPAHAEVPPSRLVQATVTASSTLPAIDGHGFSPGAGVDEVMDSYWCEGNPKGAVGEWLSIVLDHPVPLADIYAIQDDGMYVPKDKIVQITAFDLEVDGKVVYTGFGPYEMKGATAKTIRVTIKKVTGPADGVACFRSVRLFIPNQPNSTYSPYTGELAAFEAFRTQSTELVGAFAKCDAKRMAAVVTFPIERHEWVGADDSGHGGRDQVTTVKTPARMAQLCKTQPKRWGKQRLFGAGELEPEFKGIDRAQLGSMALSYKDGRWTMTEL